MDSAADDFSIRPAAAADAAGIAALYNHYVAHTRATLQTVPAQAEDFLRAIGKVPFLVAVDSTDSGEVVQGYCYSDVMKSRCGYAFTHELSIYVAAAATQRGIGNALMEAFLQTAEALPIHKLVAVIGLPNPASISLHEKFGFVHCGTLPNVGWKFGKWQDVGYWVLDLKGEAPPAAEGGS